MNWKKWRDPNSPTMTMTAMPKAQSPRSRCERLPGKTTVNIAEYTGMNKGVLAAIDHGADDLVVVGDSRLAIQQSLGVIACRKESLMTQLSRHRDYGKASISQISSRREVKIPAPRGPIQHSALNDSATVSGMTRQQARPKKKKTQKTFQDPLPTTPRADDVDPVAIQAERRSQIAKAQDEELRWSNIKLFLRGEVEKLGYKAARDALKIADKFVLPDDGVLQYVGASRRETRENQEETHLRLVVPITMI
ncbi:unnamed protein product [Phytophthora lilii]|uniref:Unnamed protein product n=1 Tax=Phytophthora lilii TaxID=2077276 RepID=A0A9W6UDL6_9STRA|nr:unnamed protein product [Phytophthora lilii]